MIDINYNEILKEFNKKAPTFLKQLGYGDEEIKNCLNEVESENIIRDKIISQLKEKYSFSKSEENFPVMTYIMDVDDENEICIKHDCSRYIDVYKNDKYNSKFFDPLEDGCLEKITEHIDSLVKNIKI